MGTRLLCWILCILEAELTAGGVAQSPRHKVIEKSQAMDLWCNPVSGHQTLYWYQQTPGQGLGLLVCFENEDAVDDSRLPKNRFSAERSKKGNSTLKIQQAELGDSAVYFCASSPNRNTQVFFGEGTRLTVVDDLNMVNPPTVTVFEPSEAEIDRTQKATLVCLATGFYPDHVELSWWVNGKEIQSGVSTDPQPSKEQPNLSNSTYCLSSRLRVSATFWHNPRNHFRCQVQFFGIAEEDKHIWNDTRPIPITQNVSAEAWGRADCGFTSVSYQQGVLSATILYEILLGKATVYAVLVSALVLMAMVKRKDS